MSASGTISNLQQALNCAGKCDCCANLQQQINQLKAELAKLKPVNERAIIDKAKYEAKDMIMPLAAGLVVREVAPVKQAVGNLGQYIDDAVYSLRGQIYNVGVKVNNVISKADGAVKTAGSALGISNSAMRQVGGIASRLASLASLVFGIFGTITALKTLFTLGARIDALEGYVDSLNAGISRVLSLLPPIKASADAAKAIGNRAYDAAQYAGTLANTAISRASGAESAANRAGNLAQNASSNAEEAKGAASNALNVANSASSKAQEANARATQADAKANSALQTAAEGLGKAIEVGLALATLNAFVRTIAARPGIPGRPGINGRNGRDGRDGRNGFDGRPGRDGAPGIQGRPGTNGRNGTNGTPGIQGRPGINGREGKQGIQGRPGRDGIDGQMNPNDTALLRQILNRVNATNANVSATGVNVISRINQNVNSGVQRILNRLKDNPLIAATYAQTVIINRKMGLELLNGLSGGLKAITNNQITQTVTNYVILATTFHNALMLSNDIAQTLFSAIDNVLKFMGINVTNANGQPVSVGTKVSEFSSNFLKSLFGTENYQALTETWAKASRIYQAGINVLNSFQGLANSILTGLEMTAGKVAKIGNALRAAGEVLDNAYSWMNPQPKFNRITQTLESLQNGASTIQMITQAPLDIINATTELTTATTELTNAIKQDENENNKGKEAPEPEQLKATKDAEKVASAGKQMTDTDLEPDEVVA